MVASDASGGEAATGRRAEEMMSVVHAQAAPGAARQGNGGGAIVAGRGISKYFGQRCVLREVDFEVTPGEMLVVMGKSGSGKSTLLRVIAGLAQPETGELDISGLTVIKEGKHLDGWATQRRLVGMVFQQYTLWPHMSVYKNLALGPRRVLRQPESEIRSRAEAALDEVGLRDRMHSRPSELSGGQRQRVAIARALMMQPRVMLCDEITSALDPPIASGVLNILTNLARNDGIACVIVTHDMAFASKAADRVMFVEDGQILEQEEPSLAFSNPSSAGLREFVDALKVK